MQGSDMSEQRIYIIQTKSVYSGAFPHEDLVTGVECQSLQQLHGYYQLPEAFVLNRFAAV